MLTQEDKNKIMELRSQDFSYQAIHDRLGFAIDTIMKAVNEEKEKKVKELGEGKGEKAEEGQIQRDVVSFDSSIQEVRNIASDINNVIKSGQLKAGDKREWEKRKEDIRIILREEVDEVRAAAVETRDEEWREFLEQNYVKQEVATNLSNSIQGKDVEIRNLKAAIKERDNLLSENQSEISQVKASHYFEKENLKDQARNLLRENIFLKENNVRQHNYIENRLDRDVRQQQGQIYHDQEVLNSKKTDFDRYVKAQQSGLNEMFIELDKKERDVERREKELAEKEDKFRKREDEFDKKIKQLFDVLNERIKSVEKREKNVTELEKRLLRQIEEQENKLNIEKKKIQDDQDQIAREWENIKKTAEQQKNKEQRFQETLGRTGSFNKDSTPHTIFRKAKLVGVTGQRTSEQPKTVTLRPV